MEKRTKKQLLIWGVVVLIIMNIASLGTIWFHKFDRGNMRERGENRLERSNRSRQHSPERMKREWTSRMHRALDLEAQQAAEFDSLFFHFEKLRRTNRSDMGELRKILDKELAKEMLNQDTIDLLIKQQSELFTKGNTHIVDMNMALREILTIEQREKYSKHMEKVRQKVRSGRGPQGQ